MQIVSAWAAGGVGEHLNLSEVSGPTEVIHFEHGGTRLGCSRLEFWRLDFWGRCQPSANHCTSFSDL